MSARAQHTGRAPWHSAALAALALWLPAVCLTQPQALPTAQADVPATPPAVVPPPAEEPAAAPAAAPAPATPTPPPRPSWFHRHRHPSPLAVEAGLKILARGGNAVDAAVAVQAMLGLVEPQSSGVGGGAFLLYYDAHTGHVTAWDGREKAPAAASPDMFLDE